MCCNWYRCARSSATRSICTERNSGKSAAVIGVGPAGLTAAEAASGAGARVDVCDAMLPVGRKFLMTGKGGLNLIRFAAWRALLLPAGAKLAAMNFPFWP